METALQQLINVLRIELIAEPDDGMDVTHNMAIENAITKATSLLETENQQMEDCFSAGMKYEACEGEAFEQYYSDTFKTT